MERFYPERRGWLSVKTLPNFPYICGYCTTKVSSVKGFTLGEHQDGSGKRLGGIYICPNCGGPTFIAPNGYRNPTPAFGAPVDHVPDGLQALHEEARRCTSQQCYTAAVLLCRKMLMNIAVDQGAEEGLRFVEYVSYLSDAGYVPPNGKHWVDHIRKKGNEATHEIALMSADDARELLLFLEMLLRFIYEFPRLVPQEEASDEAR